MRNRTFDIFGGFSRAGAWLGAALFLVSCSAPVADPSSAHGKQAILDAVDLALTSGDCKSAVAQIEPLYHSSNTDNDVRLRAASAYGCNAGVNLFTVAGDLASNGGTLAGSGFWATMSKMFPSTGGQDYVVEGALLAADALQSALRPGALVLPSNQIGAGSYNVGSVFPSDRIDDANLYMIFIEMAAIGSIQNRYGSPNSNYGRGQLLKWNAANRVDSDGCAYASSILNLLDAIGSVKEIAGTNLQSSLTNTSSVFLGVLNQACAEGCAGGVSANPALNSNGNWVDTGCSNAVVGDCTTCPTSLRDRTSCKGSTSDAASCAAAGIVNFINSSALGWQ